MDVSELLHKKKPKCKHGKVKSGPRKDLCRKRARRKSR